MPIGNAGIQKKCGNMSAASYKEAVSRAIGLRDGGNLFDAAETLLSTGMENWFNDPDGVALMIDIFMDIDAQGHDVTEKLVLFSRRYLTLSYGPESKEFPSSGLIQTTAPDPVCVLNAVMLLLCSTHPNDGEKQFMAGLLAQEGVVEHHPHALATAGFLAFEAGDFEGAIRLLSSYFGRMTRPPVKEDGGYVSPELQTALSAGGQLYPGGAEQVNENTPPDTDAEKLMPEGKDELDFELAMYRRAIMVISMAAFAVKDHDAGMRYLEILRSDGVGLHNESWSREYIVKSRSDETQGPGIIAFPESLGIDGMASGDGQGNSGCLMEIGSEAEEERELHMEGAPVWGNSEEVPASNPKVFFSVALLPDGSFRKIPPGII